MTRRILVAATLAMLSTTAFAADLLNYKPAPLMAPVPAFDWTGFHVGVVAGYAVDGNDAKYSYNKVPASAVALLPTAADLTSRGANVGGSVGYDHQMNGLVLGMEGDISWMNLGDHNTVVVPGDPATAFPRITLKTDDQMDWLSTIRGRIGIPFDRLLVYGTGGLAVADVSMHTTVQIGTAGSLVGSTDETKVGWTAGGGAELALTDHIAMKGEVLYFDLGDASVNASNPLVPYSVDADKKVTGVIARGGVNYKF
jgi:outer membrane immunogenic protein